MKKLYWLHIQILLWDRMSAYDDLHPIAFFKKSLECMDVRTGWISDDHPGRQVNHLRAVLHHFFARAFHVAPRTTVASGVPNQLYFCFSIDPESALLVLHCPQAFSTGATTVTVTNDDSYLRFCAHCCSFDRCTIVGTSV